MLALAFASANAFAHAHLVRAQPAADSTVDQSPASLDLFFTEGLNPAFTHAVLYRVDGGASAPPIETGKPTVDAANAKHLSETVPGALAPGRYTVKWQAVAVDGHKTQGQYDFTVK